MVDFISELYYYASIIPDIKKVISFCYCHNISEVKDLWNDITPRLIKFCSLISSIDTSLSNNIMKMCEEACSCTTCKPPNYTLMGDKLSLVIPYMYSAMSLIASIDVSEGSFHLFSSRSGFLTFEKIGTNNPYHSMIDPYTEATSAAEKVYISTNTSFHIAGCGLGYLPYAIFAQSDSSVEIFIYHISSEIVNYAIEYGYLSKIDANKLHINLFSNTAEMLSALNMIDFEDISNGYASLPDIFDFTAEEYHHVINNVAISGHTHAHFIEQTSINLWRNVSNVPKTIYELVVSKPYTTFIVVAAGPSLDSKMSYIKENSSNSIIICASTVYKKLLNNGVIPDYVCVCDPQSRTFKHFEEISDTSSTLLLEATANWRFSEFFSGPTYLVPSSSCATALYYFKSLDIVPFHIVGSVSYMCVLMAQFLGATTIHLVGMDLAYPNGMSHASGTMDSHKVNTADLIDVPCVDGGVVQTSPQYKFYIDTMNTLFTSMQSMDIVNHSDSGARFENTKWYKD